MGRSLHVASGDLVYHVLNRANAGRTLFEDTGDYGAFQRVLLQACGRGPVRLLPYCLMPNHWHLVVWPRHDGDLSRLMNWLTLTHTQRWHQHHQSVGDGHVYQGRFKSFPVETNEYLVTVCRYVERNPVRGGPRRTSRTLAVEQCPAVGIEQPGVPLSSGPTQRPADWLQWVNQAERQEQMEAVRCSVSKGQLYGSVQWVTQMVAERKVGRDDSKAGATEDKGAGKWFLTPFCLPKWRIDTNCIAEVQCATIST